uniref:Uncharacterized protein n=1 Tax=Avena sativa TaxID=4498 RepID=A0ACD5V3Q5_AVESA
MDAACVYLGVALVSLFIVLASRRLSQAHGGDGRLRLPPGPWQLPVVGSLHHFTGKLPHRAMRDLARRHGPAMLLRLGEVPTLVVSSREGAREVMKTHDTAFATRPLSTTMRVITNGGRDIVFAPYGDYWRQLRKIAVTELFTARRVLSFRAIREEEVAAVLREVGEAAERPVEMHALLSALVADSTVHAVMGDRCKERDAFLRELDRSLKLSAGFNPADLWPSSRLAVRFSGAARRAKECRDAVYGILDGIIQEHLERMDSGRGHDDDLLDVLLKIQKEGGLQFPLDMDAIKSVIFDIFGAGSETAATTLEWAIAELIKNPNIMQKATAEVRQAFHSRGAVAEHALGELHYLHLVVRETLRLHTPLPRCSRESARGRAGCSGTTCRGARRCWSTPGLWPATSGTGPTRPRSSGRNGSRARARRRTSGGPTSRSCRSAPAGGCALAWRSASPTWSSRSPACSSILIGSGQARRRRSGSPRGGGASSCCALFSECRFPELPAQLCNFTFLNRSLLRQCI